MASPFDFACSYDDDAFYDINVPYDGNCPEPAPIDFPTIRIGRSSESKRNKQYCRIEIDRVVCYLNGKEIESEQNPISFYEEEFEDKIAKLYIEKIRVRKKSDYLIESKISDIKSLKVKTQLIDHPSKNKTIQSEILPIIKPLIIAEKINLTATEVNIELTKQQKNNISVNAKEFIKTSLMDVEVQYLQKQENYHVESFVQS